MSLAAALVAAVCWAPAIQAQDTDATGHVSAHVSAIDGLFAEWDDVTPVWSDPTQDTARDTAAGSGVDFGRIWAASDSERITLSFEIGTDINLQNGNAMTLFLDGDGDPGTGHPVEGIGAELAWTFGHRTGVVWTGGSDPGAAQDQAAAEHPSGDRGLRKREVGQADIGLLQAPTVSSTRFEISLLRRTIDGTPIAPGPTAGLVLINETGSGSDRLPDGDGLPHGDGLPQGDGLPDGDRLPDGAAHVELTLSNDAPPPQLPVSLGRENPDDIRILTWNVLFDGLFKRPAPFIRVLRAIDPDVICFQEIWAHTAQEAADQVSLALPESHWHAAASGEGHVVSRYPTIAEASIDESGNYWALIDLPDDRYETDLSVVSAHPPCCEKEAERQRELDGIAAWMRELVAEREVKGTDRGTDESSPAAPESSAADAATDDEALAVRPGVKRVPWGTPVVIAGDMNLVGRARQVRTLTHGEISDEETFGPSSPADWDGTALADAWPRHAGGQDVYTWRDARSSFAPGRLDYIVYSDSVLKLARNFVLETEHLPAEALSAYGLRREDTLEASDHLPVVADLAPILPDRDAVTPGAAPARKEADE